MAELAGRERKTVSELRVLCTKLYRELNPSLDRGKCFNVDGLRYSKINFPNIAWLRCQELLGVEYSLATVNGIVPILLASPMEHCLKLVENVLILYDYCKRKEY